ncbi:MAG TPA: hypothetical protein VG122_17720 [Gemmata sp.]|nr:hypothetical protein [Gemmata sp.]
MSLRTRRELFHDVGRGMFAAALGPVVASDLGLGFAAEEAPKHLTFGDLDPLVSFLQETHPSKLLPKVAEKLKAGTDLKQFIAAAALVNARAFGGEDYDGYHTLMALAPAYWMSMQETREERRPLAVMKVLMRNSNRLQAVGGANAEVLKPVKAGKLAADQPRGEQLREIVRKSDMAASEATFAAICDTSKPEDALNALMMAVDDATDVHRIVLVSRAWDLVGFVGAERAHTLLRQSVHFCVQNEGNAAKRSQQVRELIPKMLDQYGLLGKKPGTKSADDEWVSKFAETIFRSTAAQAGEAVAAAIGEGIEAEAISQAIGVAANQLITRDEGRPKSEGGNKPAGSIHGDSIGVHACDSAHAWRHLARAGDRRTQVTSLILAGYQVARDRGERGGNFLNWDPYPRAEHQEKVKGVAADSLLKELDGAIREKNQSRAAALTNRIVVEKPDSIKELIALFRGFATSEDGALHAEKFFITATQEFEAARPIHRAGQLVGLSRVTASEYGLPAPGFKEACDLMKG